MRTHANILTLSLVVLFGACQAPVELDGEATLGQREAAIVNGQTYSGHPSVGQLQIGGGGLCTATLIGKRTVLTAAHCIGSSHTFYIGGKGYPAVSAKRHPQYSSYTQIYDIAVIILGSEPPITPSAIPSSAPTLGMEVTLIGYGVTSENGNDSGIKRMAKNTIAQLDATEMNFLGATGSKGNTCYGDSGGPAFATINGQEVVVGVTSRGTPPCGVDGIDTRVDAYRSWLTSEANGDVVVGGTTPPPPPPPPADTTAPQVQITSPTTNAMLTNPLTTVTANISDNVGVKRAELQLNGHLVASASVAPYAFNVNLPQGIVQITVVAYDAAGNQGGASVNVTVQSTEPGPGPGPQPEPPIEPSPAGSFGATCSSPADCQSGLCADDGSGLAKYCTQSCNPTMNNCALAAQCLPSGGGSYVCGRPQGGSPNPTLPGNPNNPPENGLEGRALVGSCAVAPAGSVPAPPISLLALALLALLLRRRR